jgi:hypothetical protein
VVWNRPHLVSRNPIFTIFITLLTFFIAGITTVDIVKLDDVFHPAAALQGIVNFEIINSSSLGSLCGL